MKKILFFLASAVIAALLLFTNQKLRAMALDPVISVDVNEVTVAVTPSDPNVHPGDYVVELKIENNSGYAGSGIGMYYDKTNFEPVMLNPPDPNGFDCAFDLGPASNGLATSVLVNQSKGRFGITTSGTANNTANGVIVTVYLKRKTNAADPNAIPSVGTVITMLATDHSVDIECEQATPYVDPETISAPVTVERHYGLEYRLGDLNGDGVATVGDANLLSSILNNSSSINATVAEARARALTDVNLDGLFHNGIICFQTHSFLM